MGLLWSLWALLALILTQGDGGGSGDGEPSADRVSENAQRMLDRHNGNAVAALAFMMGENARDRKGQADAKAEAARLQAQINEGRLLTKEQLAQWEAYQALGTPDELKTVKTERDNLRSETTKTAREKLLAEVAEAEELKVGPLTRLARRDDGSDVEIILREVEEDGQKRKRGYVKEGDKETPIMQYAQSNWSDFIDSLRANPQGGGTEPNNTGAQGASGGFPGQGRGAQPRTGQNINPAQQVIANRYKRPGAKPAAKQE